MKTFKRFLPLLLSILIVIVDQYTKLWVMKTIPLNTIYKEYLGDFLWIVHVRNTGAAFSMGASSSMVFRIVVFIIFPIVIMGVLTYAIISKKDYFTTAQCWFAAGIVGGGVGTIIDRIVRFDEGVVDFISVNFYGLFGLERWPTFNVSDSMVVVFVFLFSISLVCSEVDGEDDDEQTE